MRNYTEYVKQVLDEQKRITDKDTERPDTLLPVWTALYAGYYEPFHKYYVYNGKDKVWFTRKTLNMAKRVSEDWASLLMSEKVQVITKDKETSDTLLRKLGFWSKLNRATEVGFALGHSGVAVEIKNLIVDENTHNVSVNDKTKIQLNYYNALRTIPITFDNGEITECGFVGCNTKDNIEVDLHILDDKGIYHIVMYRKNKEKETIHDLNTMSTEPLFTTIAPNIENNLFINSPYPLSIFANALDVLKSIDDNYDSLDNEITLGRKRIFVSADMNKMEYVAKGSDGTQQAVMSSTFDTNDTLIYGLPNGGNINGDKPLIYSPNDPLRVQDLTLALKTQLNVLAQKVGLGNDYYSFERGSVMTATQVISEKSDCFRNIRKHELRLEKSLHAIVKAIIYANNTFTNEPQISEDDVKIVFDDSIIEDRKSEQERDDKNLANGSMSLVEYRMKYFGEDKDTAEKVIYEINGRSDLVNRLTKYLEAFNAGLMTAKMFVNLAYTDEDLKASGTTKEELIAILDGTKSTENSITKDELIASGEYQPPEE